MSGPEQVCCRPMPSWGPAELAESLPPGPLALLDGLTHQGRRCALVAWEPGPAVHTLEGVAATPGTLDLPAGTPPLLGAAVGSLDWDGSSRFWVPGAAALFDPAAGCLWTRGDVPRAVTRPTAAGGGPCGAVGGDDEPGGSRSRARVLWDRPGFTAAAREAIRRMEEGDLRKVILSVPFAVACADSPFTLYRRLTADHPPGLRFLLLGPGGQGALTGVSPEPLVLLTGGRVQMHLLAGTRPAGAAAGEELLAHPKDRAEHTLAVEQGRRDLLTVCLPESVQVPAFMVPEHHGNLVHLASHLEGRLRPGVSPAAVVRACFPTATVGGVPRDLAVMLINHLEPVPRHWYAGAVGALLPGGDLQLWLTIRSLALADGVGLVRAGAGLVKESDPAAEWQECMNKARRPLAALGAEVADDA